MATRLFPNYFGISCFINVIGKDAISIRVFDIVNVTASDLTVIILTAVLIYDIPLWGFHAKNLYFIADSFIYCN